VAARAPRVFWAEDDWGSGGGVKMTGEVVVELESNRWIGNWIVGRRDGPADNLNVDGKEPGECCHLSI